MKHVYSAASPAAAGQVLPCVTGPSTVAVRQLAPFAPVSRWDLLTAVIKLRRRLKLTSNDLTVLRALISFVAIPAEAGREALVKPDMLLVVFASNDAIAERANGLDERVLRLCFSRLAAAGLIARKDSASGKRFPIRLAGKIVDAYGLDLRPAFVMAPALFDLAAELDAEAERTRALRAQLMALRRQMLATGVPADAHAHTLLGKADLMLRRQTSSEELNAIINALEASHCADPVTEQHVQVRPDAAAASPTDGPVTVLLPPKRPESSASDGGNYRHTEHERIDLKKRRSELQRRTEPVWTDFANIVSLFPEPPRTELDTQGVIRSLAGFIGISRQCIEKVISIAGTELALHLTDRLIGQCDRIKNPDAWLYAAIKGNGRLAGSMTYDRGHKAPASIVPGRPDNRL